MANERQQQNVQANQMSKQKWKSGEKRGRCEKLQRGNQSNLHASKLQTGNEEKWKIQK